MSYRKIERKSYHSCILCSIDDQFIYWTEFLCILLNIQTIKTTYYLQSYVFFIARGEKPWLYLL